MIKKSYKRLINGESPRMAFWLIGVVIVLIFFFIPWLLIKPSFISGFDFSSSGAIGDTIGGITNPLIALLAAVLTFLAFWVQFQANQRYERQIRKQEISTDLDRFASRYFEQLKLHRDNVLEFNIEDKIYGRKCFQPMFNEFKLAYYALVNIYNRDKKSGISEQELVEEDLINISYITFFTGIGDSSQQLAFDLLKNYERGLLLNYFEYLKEYQSLKDKKIAIDIGTDQVFSMKKRYRLFEGHVSRLGHYFRHLFQLVKYIDEQPNEIVPNKYEYMKTVRAQLSNFEQLLLYYNSFSVIGKSWVEERYIQNYRIIKNIPLSYADIGVTPEEKFGKFNDKGELNFEWHEIQDRIEMLNTGANKND